MARKSELQEELARLREALEASKAEASVMGQGLEAARASLRACKAEVKEARQDLKAADATISELIRQRDQADQVAARAKDELESGRASFSIEGLLEMEGPAREAAHSYPDGPNADAVKAALTNASHGIGHVRKTLDHLRRVNA